MPQSRRRCHGPQPDRRRALERLKRHLAASPDGRTEALNKIDVAEAHLITAVRAHFRGEHPASIYLLAASAREILTTIGEKIGTQTMLATMAEDMGMPFKKLVELVHEPAGFFKHADRNPSAILETFTEMHVDNVLLIACRDFYRVTKGQPIELQVYEAWWFARSFNKVNDLPLRSQPTARKCVKLFPGIRRVSRAEQQRIGLEQLEKARHDSAFQMKILDARFGTT